MSSRSPKARSARQGSDPGKIIIGSRGSDLALWQARFIRRQLRRFGLSSQIKIIKTQGDRIQNLSFDKLEGKGFFTKEIEEALLNGSIDLAVHSHKDLPTEKVPGLVIAAVSEREDPGELLLVRKNKVDLNRKYHLCNKAIVGTSSARRKSQLLAFRPDVRIKDLRGNVPTRVRKLSAKNYDAILIAKAGVKRLKLKLDQFHCVEPPPEEFIPAPAQGVLALQIREKDHLLFRQLQKLHSKHVAEVIGVERRIMNLFQGGCQLPLGVYCKKQPGGKFIVYTAKSETWNDAPCHLSIQSRSTFGLADMTVKKLKALNNKRNRPLVFISRNERHDDLLRNVLQSRGYRIKFESLIRVKQIKVNSAPKSNWVFFSSKNGVKHFFGQKLNSRNAKFAAVGAATAEALFALGKKVEFIGTGNSISHTAREFAKRSRGGTVLFPGAKESLRSVQKHLPHSNVFDLAVYESLPVRNKKMKAAHPDILVFTSPKNAQHYLDAYQISKNQKVIAMGEATAGYLKRKKIKVHAIPDSFSDLGLIYAINNL